MLNIPTDLLRTLVAVTDMRSFTKAAQSLGVTQPAVSAQIKRLQYLLGYEVLDKSAPGVSLTPRGEIVVNNARRLLVHQRRDPAADQRPHARTDHPGRHSDRLCGLAAARNADPVSPAVARYQLQRQQRAGRRHAARPQAGRARPRAGAVHRGADHRGAPCLDAGDRLGAQRRHQARSRRSGAAGILWRATAPASASRSPRSIAPASTAISSSPRTAWSAWWPRSRPASA